jgi:CIC family chloride channel protein
MIEDGIMIDFNATLGRGNAAVRACRRAAFAGGHHWRPEGPQLLGVLLHVDALRTYNRALAATAAEEHS